MKSFTSLAAAGAPRETVRQVCAWMLAGEARAVVKLARAAVYQPVRNLERRLRGKHNVNGVRPESAAQRLVAGTGYF